jgi:hypothetical protein
VGRFSRSTRLPAQYAASDCTFQPTHRWWWKAKLGERHRQPCAVLARGKMNSILVGSPLRESFASADGHAAHGIRGNLRLCGIRRGVLTSRHAVRKL